EYCSPAARWRADRAATGTDPAASGKRRAAPDTPELRHANHVSLIPVVLPPRARDGLTPGCHAFAAGIPCESSMPARPRKHADLASMLSRPRPGTVTARDAERESMAPAPRACQGRAVTPPAA